MTAAQQQTQQKPLAIAKPARMTLASVIKGKVPKPIRATIYGGAGVGKTTFGAGAPAPIFLGAEDGTAQLDVARFPKPESLADVFEAIRTLTDEAHEFKSLVIDSLDWLEPVIWKFLCEQGGVEHIEEYGGGYGKGYKAAVDHWRRLLAALERLQAAKQMHVVLVAHAQVKKFQNPEGQDFDRYQMKLNETAGGLVKEWSDALLFARHEVLAHEDKKKRVRGVSTGARIIHTNERASFDAKNRYSLPDTLPLSWTDFTAAVDAGRVADPKDLRAEIEAKAKELGGDVEQKVAETLKKAGDNAQSLAVILNRINARLAEKEQ